MPDYLRRPADYAPKHGLIPGHVLHRRPSADSTWPARHARFDPWLIATGQRPLAWLRTAHGSPGGTAARRFLASEILGVSVMVMNSSSPTVLLGFMRWGVFVKLNASTRNCSLTAERG